MGKPAFTGIVLSLLPLFVAACMSEHRISTTPAQNVSPASPAHPAPGAETLTAQLKTVDGQPVATATFEFANGYATITVKTVATGMLRPGFHDMHIHSVGKCEPHSTAPTGGAPGAFLSAGPHYQAPGHTGMPPSGDLPSLEVRRDGAALLVTTSDAFTRADLLAGSKTALVLHGAEYTPDAEERVACGVIGPG
ncbi:superoxide dismutase family protein [Mycobacterium botniense]|nr:superoxide dismutase family protein [Mycobacterium botniense]